MCFSRSSVSKESVCSLGDLSLIPGSERSHGYGNHNPLQYSCLENPMDRGAWQNIVHGVARVRHDLGTKSPPQRNRLQKTFLFQMKKIPLNQSKGTEFLDLDQRVLTISPRNQ